MQKLATLCIILVIVLIIYSKSKPATENFYASGFFKGLAANVAAESIKKISSWIQQSGWWAREPYKNKLRYDSNTKDLYATPYDKEILVGRIDLLKPSVVIFENNQVSLDERLIQLYKYPNLGKISNIGPGGQRIIDKQFLIRHKTTNWILCPVDITRDQAGNWVQGAKLAFVKSPQDIGMCLFTYNSDMRFVHVKSGMRLTAGGGAHTNQAYLWYCDLRPGATRNCQWFMSGEATKIQQLSGQDYLWATMWDTGMEKHDLLLRGQGVAGWADTEMVFDITNEKEYYGDSINTCNWFDDFMNKNPDAAKIRDKIKINKETKTVYVPPMRPGVRYFSLQNRQSRRCLHPEGGSDNPGHDTRIVLWSECPNGPIDSVPDKLKMFHGSDGAIYLKNGSCVNAWYNGAGNGNPVVYSKQWCGQPIDLISNGALRHRYSGRCLHPDGGRPNQGTKLVTWDGCQSDNRLLYNKIDLGYESDKIIGYVDDGHIGNIRMSDGTWVPIQNIFTLIAGPSEQFVIENFELFLSPEDAKTFQEKFLSETSREEFGWNPFSKSGWSWASSAGNWIKDRAKDVGNFAKNAAGSVGEWAKNLGNSIANWAQNMGKGLVENLVKIGSIIGDTARNIARTIADTAMNTVNRLKELAEEAARLAKELALKAWEELKKIQYALKIFGYLKDLGSQIIGVIWDKIKEAINSIKTAFVNFIRDKVIDPLKRKAGEFLWWAEHDLKKAVRMIMEALTPLVSAISGVVLDFAVRPIHKTIVNLLSAETMEPFEPCVWGGITYKGNPKKGQLGCPLENIDKLLKLIGKKLPGTKGVKHELTPQVNKLFVLIAEQFPSPLVNAVRGPMLSNGLKAIDPNAQNAKAYIELKKAANPKSGIKLSPIKSMNLVEKASKLIAPGDSKSRAELYKLAQITNLALNARRTGLGGLVIVANSKQIEQSIKSFRVQRNDPIKALQKASVSKTPMNPKTANYLASLAQSKLQKPRNPNEAKANKNAITTIKTLTTAATSATPLKKTSAIKDVKIINKAIPKLNTKDKVPVVKVTNRTLGLVMASSLKKTQQAQIKALLKQEAKQSLTPSCVAYKPDSKGVSQKCYSELWKLSCRTNTPQVDSKKQFKYLANDILFLSKLKDIASVKKCYGEDSKQYKDAQKSINAMIARDRAAAVERSTKLKAAVARDRADTKVVKAKNVEYAIQRQISSKQKEIKSVQRNAVKQQKAAEIQTKKAKAMLQSAKTQEEKQKAVQQVEKAKMAEAKAKIAISNAQKVTLENKKEIKQYNKDLKKSIAIVTVAQKQQAVVKSKTNIKNITVVSNVSKAFITAAGSEKGMSQEQANKLKKQALATIKPDNTKAISAVNTLANMATKDTSFNTTEAEQLATVAISTGQTVPKEQGFLAMILKLLGITM